MQIHLLIVCGMCIYILPLPSLKFKENVWETVYKCLIYGHFSYFLNICDHSCLGLLILHALSVLSSEVSGRRVDVRRSPAD